jgi:membrane protein required for colicin V production
VNWLDMVLAIILAASVAAGFAKGLARTVVGFAACLIGLLGGLWFYGTAGSFLIPYVSSRGIANGIGFFLVFLGTMIVGGLLGRLLAMLFKWVGLSWLDRALGGVFGLVRGALVAAVVVMTLLAFTPTPPPGSVVRSRIAPYVMDTARVMAALAPRELRDGVRQGYEKVKQVWSDTLKKSTQIISPEGA